MKKVLLLSVLVSFSAFGMEGDGADKTPKELIAKVDQLHEKFDQNKTDIMALIRDLNQKFGQIAPQVNGLNAGRMSIRQYVVAAGFGFFQNEIWDIMDHSPFTRWLSVMVVTVYLVGFLK